MTEDQDLAALYQPRIRELASRVRNDKRLELPDVTVTCRSPVCGSTLTLDVSYSGETISELGWRSRACTLGMASTAIFVKAAIEQSADQIAQAGKALEQLLAGCADITFDERWSSLSLFEAAREFPSRHRSIMLPFNAAEEAAAEMR